MVMILGVKNAEIALIGNIGKRINSNSKKCVNAITNATLKKCELRK